MSFSKLSFNVIMREAEISDKIDVLLLSRSNSPGTIMDDRQQNSDELVYCGTFIVTGFTSYQVDSFTGPKQVSIH